LLNKNAAFIPKIILLEARSIWRSVFYLHADLRLSMNNFRTFIESYVPLSSEDWTAISKCFEQKIFEKNQMILQEGKICRHLYFLESGLLRYFIEKDGAAITKYFTDAPYCFTSQVSFTAETPTTDNIQALERSVMWQTTLQQANALLELKSWNTFIRKLIQEVQFYTESILQEVQTETAENRYIKMLERNPDLIRRIPLGYLASYFGIAPQSLSRIRKKITLKSGI
jgi:CRP-like cAMP-binding protein